MIKKSKLWIAVAMMVGTLSAADYTKKELDGIARMDYIKPYDALNDTQKKAVVTKLKKYDLLLELGKKSGIEQRPEYKKALENSKRRIILRMYLKEQKASQVVTKEEIKSYYEKNIRDYTRVHVYIWSRKTGKAAEAIAKKCIAKLKVAPREKLFETFKKLSKQYSNHPRFNRAGDMGYVSYGSLGKPIGKYAFAAEPNSVTEIFESPLGVTILYVGERKIKSLEEVSRSIESKLRSQKYRAWFKELDKQIK